MACALCGHDTFEPVCSLDAKSGEALSVSLCCTCGLIQQTPIPSTEELRIYYSHHYRMDYKQTYYPKPGHVYRAANVAINRLSYLREHGISGGTLLDVGAGGGEFVYLANRLGFDARGIEPNQGYSEYASREYDCTVDTAELADVSGRVDVITLFHVLEHLPSPRRAFEMLHSALNPNGMLFVEVPAFEADDTSPRNIFFRAHIFYFLAETLKACASPFFDVGTVEVDYNLRALLKPRTTPGEVILPGSHIGPYARDVVRRKTWMNYLIRGGGYKKFLEKNLSRMGERRFRTWNGRQIIDTALAESALGSI